MLALSLRVVYNDWQKGRLVEEEISCFRCGTCCIAPDIATLRKPVGVPCRHLTADHLCGIYPQRPPVCREYRPDEICLALQKLPTVERVPYFLEIYDLDAEQESEPPAPPTQR